MTARTLPIRRSTRFRAMLEGKETRFVMEAHNGLSARLAERAGFEALWASGLSIASALGVRDSNEASWTEVVQVVEFMADASTAPIMVDGDTGFGNFNNARRLVRKLSDRGIAALCMEDKLFPKTNSFVGEAQPLADAEEFALKIRACKDSQVDPDFSIVARTEALISGHGMAEALRRAEIYRQAGADAILIHSKKRKADEILEFAREWDDRCPLVIVPTTYYDTPVSAYREAKIRLVIWANHAMRAATAAMEKVYAEIYAKESIAGVEPEIASVKHVFDVMNYDELAADEDRYLPSTKSAETGTVVPMPKRAEPVRKAVVA